MAPRVTFDVTTLTLGEASKVEMASGERVKDLMKGTFSRLLLGLYVHELRTSAQPRSWHELSSLKVLDDSSSTSESPADGASEKSSSSPTEN